MHIFDLWCIESGSNPEKNQGVINLVELNITNNGFEVDLSELKKIIGYLCKKIIFYGLQHKRG